jgi:hypothetical protein
MEVSTACIENTEESIKKIINSIRKIEILSSHVYWDQEKLLVETPEETSRDTVPLR